VKPLAQQTLYELLEVPPNASAGDIEAAYARAKAMYGPDSLVTYSLLSPDDAELLTSRLDEARTTLLDPGARARYDEQLSRAPAPAPSPVRGEGAWATTPPVFAAVKLAPPPPEDDDEDEEADELEREERLAALAPEAREAAQASPQPAAEAVPAAASAPAAEAAPAPGAPAEPPPPPAAAAPPPPPPAPRAAPIRLEREISAPVLTPPPVARPAPPPPHRDLPIPDATVWTGEVLRQVRESRGITIQQISERTKVVRHHIENIEADRYGLLPASVYLRGILLGIARELRLDGQKVARSYLECIAAAGVPGAPSATPKR
jgi:hypothetical protein